MRLNLINTFLPNVDEVRPTLSDKRVRHSPARPSQAAPPKSDIERSVPERTAAVDARSCRGWCGHGSAPLGLHLTDGDHGKASERGSYCGRLFLGDVEGDRGARVREIG